MLSVSLFSFLRLRLSYAFFIVFWLYLKSMCAALPTIFISPGRSLIVTILASTIRMRWLRPTPLIILPTLVMSFHAPPFFVFALPSRVFRGSRSRSWSVPHTSLVSSVLLSRGLPPISSHLFSFLLLRNSYFYGSIHDTVPVKIHSFPSSFVIDKRDEGKTSALLGHPILWHCNSSDFATVFE